MNALEGRSENPNRRVFLHDTETEYFMDLYSSLADIPARNLMTDFSPRLFERAILGLPKVRHRGMGQDIYRDSVLLRYEFAPDVAVGFREIVLRRFDVSFSVDVARPKVVLISRGVQSTREVTNLREIADLIWENCERCELVELAFEQLSLPMQMKAVADASVLVGVHGSGLGHVMWMPRETANFTGALVEILPYKYDCRDWYQTAAELAGVRYFSVMNRRAGSERHPWSERRCWSDNGSCWDVICHDILKNQVFQLELDVFNETWQKVRKILQENRRKSL
jgi:hypothetical protein